MNNKIGKISIEVVPWHFNDRSSELRISVIENNHITTSVQILDVSDMESHFDYIFDNCREMLRSEIKKRLEKK